MAVTVAVIVAWTSAACDASTGGPAAAAPSLSASTGNALVLGPRGVGPLRLGMPHEELLGTGTARDPLGARHDGWPRGCRVVHYRADRWGRTPDDTLNGALSSRHGLEQLSATPRMTTPEGISLGSSVQDVRAAYGRPGVQAWDLVVVPAGAEAVYRIQLSNVVTSISLELRDLDCRR
ncbi:MAG: hypothetical protein JWN91_683 [Nocardioides sp.]|nr:hypothetical protein [Nocardioides sp.]